ncbi:hypothetical protein BCR41DRAFT_399854 [Lobosporangium transversale]|uniref:F-box domain-containing protein n=1 Tax=Lobosporangium transversale TaxID=64571 RepID=A0A1Y2GGL6_9FUNG|nr:hypothetical protein BCR41DRAFT_399854 [Lobosporangium transversale]ORZ06995.1 hypothetical protein BCR41DRAFT_399854 [Lobosporangium transversale]|eukprot:XP_021877791.1 hypothetical protein BCR41DRAFT_399854 [Lobosporangium transversale]
MDNLKLNPLQIPEILLLIAELLNKRDLLNCIRVSKAFHKTLISLIWKKITVGQVGEPGSKAIQKHNEYIEEITFDGYGFNDSFPEKYESLQRLQSITYKGWCSWPKPIHAINQIKAHSSIITSLCLNECIKFSCSSELWEALLECINLRHLEVYDKAIDVGADLFLQVCKRLDHLKLYEVSIQLPINFFSNEDSEYIFPNIRTLRISHVRITNPPHPYSKWYCLGMLVRNCRALRSLHIESWDEKDQSDYRAFLQHPWALNNLSDLWFRGMIIEDKDMAAILRRMTGLRQLGLPYAIFDQLSLQELLADKQEVMDNGQLVRKTRLLRLCETVETLVFHAVSGENSSIIQAILSNCPRLKTLEGSKTTVSEIVDGAEWVCAGLTHLDIYLEADIDQETEEGMAKARIAFKQLGKLTQLEYLSLTRCFLNPPSRTLDMRLRAGLDELANLKRLHTLSFLNVDQQRMQLEDTTWMPGMENKRHSHKASKAYH